MTSRKLFNFMCDEDLLEAFEIVAHRRRASGAKLARDAFRAILESEPPVTEDERSAHRRAKVEKKGFTPLRRRRLMALRAA